MVTGVKIVDREDGKRAVIFAFSYADGTGRVYQFTIPIDTKGMQAEVLDHLGSVIHTQDVIDITTFSFDKLALWAKGGDESNVQS
jgi:hypothetical protein